MQTILWVTITIGNDAKHNVVINFSMIESIVLTRTSVIFKKAKHIVTHNIKKCVVL